MGGRKRGREGEGGRKGGRERENGREIDGTDVIESECV